MSRCCRAPPKRIKTDLEKYNSGSIDTGSAAEKLAGLQGLCEEVGISRIPTTITKCKKVKHECSEPGVSFHH